MEVEVGRVGQGERHGAGRREQACKRGRERGSEQYIYIYKGYLAERRETAGWGVGARLGRGEASTPEPSLGKRTRQGERGREGGRAIGQLLFCPSVRGQYLCGGDICAGAISVRGQYLCGGNICAGVISVRGPKIKQSAPSMLCPRPAGGLGPAHARGREVVRAHSFDCACVRACVRSCERSSFARACACACAGLGPAEGIGLTGRSTLRSTHRRE